jgi:hypothetical protein
MRKNLENQFARLGCLGSSIGVLTLSLGLLLLGGCKDSGRHAIHGVVTFNNTPLEKGYVAIRPQPGTTSPSAGGDIVGGRFSIAAEKGLLPGVFRVEITASRLTGKQIRDPLRGMVPEEIQFIPAKYNTASQLTLTIPSDVRDVAEELKLSE